MKELIEAAAGSPELDLLVMKAIGEVDTAAQIAGDIRHYPSSIRDKWWVCDSRTKYHKHGNVTRYTRSLDATENALPDGWGWAEMTRYRDELVYMWFASCIEADSGTRWAAAHESLPIARTLAMLKAWGVER